MRRASHALAAYIVITLVATWPLVLGLGRDVAWDLGDSLLNMWILAWGGEQLLGVLRGDVSRLATFFDANIFYPAPLTLAFSEHMFAQAVQVLPVYAATGNPILAYNLVFLSTFVLSGLGTYLLVRELTGNPLAAFVAGLLFAFAPYRLAQSSHVQVLSAQWMPFVLYGMRRYFATGAHRVTPLLWAAIALVAQNLSCGYYLLYFAPFVAGYVLWEIAQRRLWRDRRVWLQLVAAGVMTIALTVPFLLPYAEVRERFNMARSMSEITRFSADVYSYGTASVAQPLWGGVMQAFPKPEGELFPGMVPIGLALVGVLFFRVRREAREERPDVAASSRWRQRAAILLAATALAHAVAAAATIVVRRIAIDVGPFELRMTNVNQLLFRATVAFALVLVLAPRARVVTARFLRDRGFYVAGLLAAVWLSLGPLPQALGRPLELAAPYGFLYEHVPGFEGVRAPARFAMIAALMLAVLGGYGAATLARGRWGRVAVIGIALAFLFEGTAVPFLVNGVSPSREFNTPEARIYRPARAPIIYAETTRHIGDGVLAELPLGDTDYDLRAVYYSTVHWRPILNGYSGFFPPHYGQLAFALGELPRHPEVSLHALRAAGATHVLVHEGAYLGNEGAETTGALRTLGAAELYRDGTDVLLALPR
jgi:hypothetical protein